LRNGASGDSFEADAINEPPVSRVGASRPKAAAPKRALKPAAANRGPVGRMQTNLATALKKEPDWTEF
jgi:hypothetical protein